MPEQQQFSSEGFDLDALAQANEDAVLELGGKVVSANTTNDETKKEAAKASKEEQDLVDDEMRNAEELKQQGNAHFKQKEWSAAHQLYSQAIDATPGHPTGAELLKLQGDWRVAQHEKMRQELRAAQPSTKNDDETDGRDGKKSTSTDDESSNTTKRKEEKPAEKFQPPPHPHGNQLAVYYSNRAAASMQMALQEGEGNNNSTQAATFLDNNDNDDDETNNTNNNPHLDAAIEDCSVALLLNPVYVKALVRRSTAYERNSKIDSALEDARAALELEPHNNAAIRKTVQRLEKLHEEHLEKLKTETLDKLKDLGNSILGNFGLSMDNFQAQKDPNTGSYSISFNQQGGNK